MHLYVTPKLTIPADDLIALITHRDDWRFGQIAKVTKIWESPETLIRYAELLCGDGVIYAAELHSFGNRGREVHPPPKFYSRRIAQSDTTLFTSQRTLLHFADEAWKIGRDIGEVAIEYRNLFHETFPLEELGARNLAKLLADLKTNQNTNGSTRNGHT